MLKASDILQFLLGLVILAAIATGLLLRVTSHRPPHRPAPPGVVSPRACNPPGWQAAASANRASLTSLQWSPFGRPESGWATYAPLIAYEIGAKCPPETGGFAQRYARWQARNKRPADGIFKADEFNIVRDALALRRPFVRVTAKGICPRPPDLSTLAVAGSNEGFGGKLIRLRPGALAAYRRMVSAARAQGLASRPPLLTLVSGYRGPDEETARCSDGGCDSLTRAPCSPHRTGLAIDLYLEPAPGADVTSTSEENRRHMAGTAEYRWLVMNAATFGFLPYPYEPWHWEWTGEPP